MFEFGHLGLVAVLAITAIAVLLLRSRPSNNSATPWHAPADPARGALGFRQTLIAAISDPRSHQTIPPGVIAAIAQARPAKSADEAKTIVILQNAGVRKVDVVKLLRYIRPDFDLATAKKTCDWAPQTIKQQMLAADADLVKAILEAVGATVRLELS